MVTRSRSTRTVGMTRAALSHPLPSAAVHRLSLYLRCLRQLEAKGVRSVSSQQLARAFHLSAAQIRKDLSQLGEFGTRGVGYEISTLVRSLSQILGLDSEHPLLLVGVGNLGTALVLSPIFQNRPFRIVALFDRDPAKLGRVVGGVRIEPMASLPQTVADKGIQLGIVAVPTAAAASVCQRLATAGIRGILNFAPVAVADPPNCLVRTVDLAVQLEELTYLLGGSVPRASGRVGV